MTEGLGHLKGEKLRAGTAQSGEEKAQGEITNVYQYLMGGSKDD